MNIAVDNFTDDADWLVTNGTVAETDWSHLTANYLPKQLLFSFTAAGTAEKEYDSPINLGTYRDLIFWIRANPNDVYTKGEIVTMRVFSGVAFVEFKVPLAKGIFHPVTFGVGFSTITKIEFEVTDAFSFFVSDLRAYEDNLPYDICLGLKNLLDIRPIEFYLGLATVTIGDNKVTLPSSQYLQQNSVIRIGNEKHIIEGKVSDKVVQFGTLYDGRTILASQTNAEVYLVVPVEITPVEQNTALPGVAIQAKFGPQITQDEEAYSAEYDTEFGDVARESKRTTTFTYKIEIVYMSRDMGDVDEKVSKHLRSLLNKTTDLYLNGRLVEAVVTEIDQPDYGDETDILTRLFFNLEVEVAEEPWQKTQIKRVTLTSQVNIVST